MATSFDAKMTLVLLRHIDNSLGHHESKTLCPGPPNVACIECPMPVLPGADVIIHSLSFGVSLKLEFCIDLTCACLFWTIHLSM